MIMENILNNIYLFKALDSYGYDLGETVEALQYALSFDPDNATALCLLGKIYRDEIQDYNLAKQCFEKALAANIEMPGLYPEYLYTLMQNYDYKEAQKLLDFALTLKNTDKAYLKLIQAQLFEAQQELKLALKSYKQSKKICLNNHFKRHVEGEIDRVKDKMGSTKKKKSRKSKRKKKK